jgi:hypothetical protein
MTTVSKSAAVTVAMWGESVMVGSRRYLLRHHCRGQWRWVVGWKIIVGGPAIKQRALMRRLRTASLSACREAFARHCL